MKLWIIKIRKLKITDNHKVSKFKRKVNEAKKVNKPKSCLMYWAE